MNTTSDPSGHPTIDDAALLEHLREHPDPVATAAELADGLDATEAAVLARLVALREDGIVDRKTLDCQTAVWWIVEDETHKNRIVSLRDIGDLLQHDAERQANTWSASWEDH